MVTESDLYFQQLFDALGHETRRQILALLREGPKSVGKIADRLPVSRPAVSKHLRALDRAGLVESRAVGTRHVFRIHPSGFASAIDYLQGFWDEALENFKRVVES